MFNYTCLNPIADVGLNLFSADYEKVDDSKKIIENSQTFNGL